MTRKTKTTAAKLPRDPAAEAALVLSSLLWLGQAALIASCVAGAIAGDLAGLLPLGAGLLALGAMRAGLDYFASGRLSALARRTVTAYRTEVLTTESRRHQSQSPAVLAGLLAEKLEMLRPAILRYGPAGLRVRTVPLVLLVVAFWQSWAAGLILLVAGPLIPVFSALVGMAAQQASARQLDQMASLGTMLSERVSALLDLRVLGAQTRVLDQFRSSADTLRKRTMEVLRIAFLTSTVLELFSSLGVAMMAVYVGFSLLGEIGFGTWGAPLSIWSGVFLLLIAPDFFAPLREMSAAWHDRAAANAVLAEVANWREAQADTILGSANRAVPADGAPVLVLHGAQIRRGDQIISYPDVTVAGGQALAVSGASGAGKSTLLAAIAGLLPVAGGQIVVNGVPLTDGTADAWRAGLGWMPQSPHFLEGSVLANLRLGAPDAERAAAMRAMEDAGVAAQVTALPKGLGTALGTSGAGLSGGEARRITLARALLAGGKVLLVDEPTADLDEETAQAVREHLLGLRASGVLLVIASHDPALIAACDLEIAPDVTEGAA